MKLSKGAFIVLSLISFLFILVSCGNNAVECSHDWTDFVVEKEATCIISGLKVKECKSCHLEIKEVISASHKYEETEVYNIGDEYPEVTVHTCSVCGNEDLEVNSEGATHTNIEITNKLFSTCKVAGHTSSVVCKCCNVEIKPLEELELAEHEYELFHSISATCYDKGLDEYKCKVCNDLEHVMTLPLNHEFELTEESKATCTEEGHQTLCCALCQETKTITLEIIPHTEQVIEAVEATCTEAGYSAGVVCSECDAVLVEVVETAKPLGHDYNEETIVRVEATCTEAGSIKGLCVRCEIDIETAIEAKGHEFLEASIECGVCHIHHYTEGLIYELSADESYYILAGIKAEVEDAVLSIPATYNELPVKEIKAGSFKDSKFEIIFIGENVTIIGSNAFEDSANLEKVYLSSSVEVIDDSAFLDASNLAYVSLAEETSLATIGVCAFTRTAIESFYIPASVTKVGAAAFYGCHSLTSISVAEENKTYKAVDGHLYSKDGKTFIQYALGQEAQEFVLASTVTKIAELAFASSKNLTLVKVHANVVEAGFYAFYNSAELVVELEVASRPAGFDENFASNIKEVIYE